MRNINLTLAAAFVLVASAAHAQTFTYTTTIVPSTGNLGGSEVTFFGSTSVSPLSGSQNINLANVSLNEVDNKTNGLSGSGSLPI